METSKSYDENIFNEILSLINKNKASLAEEKLNSIAEKKCYVELPLWAYTI